MAAVGYMEQLKPIIYEFTAYTCGEDGPPEPFYMAIRAPEVIGDMLANCQLILPSLRARPLIIHGVDGDQAVELARHFVEVWLGEEQRLVDSAGRPVDLPPAPKSGI